MKLKEKKLHDYVDKNIDKLVEAWAHRYHMIELVYGVDTLLNEKERMWKNSSSFRPQWYSETEIKEYISDMDTVEIENLIEYQKGI